MYLAENGYIPEGDRFSNYFQAGHYKSEQNKRRTTTVLGGEVES